MRVIVVQKRSRLTHYSKYWGGILNVEARCYVHHLISKINPLPILEKQV